MSDTSRSRMLTAWGLSLLLVCGASYGAADDIALKVVTDRENALYDVGETATFVISVKRGEASAVDGEITYLVDDYLNGGRSAGLPEGRVTIKEGDQPLRISVRGRRPEFLRCVVNYSPTGGKAVKAVKAIAAAGFSPEKIAPSLPVPDDFDAFWKEQKRKLSQVELDPKLTTVAQGDETIECFDTLVQCLGGAPASGYFARPLGAGPNSLPAILWVHGAGVRSSSLANAVKGAKQGFLSMDINAHGLPNGKPAAFYAAQNVGPLKNYRHAGRESRDTSYFRGMFLRLVRAIDFLASQPEWDGKHVVVVGHSQGGGQALAAGGLDSRVTFVASGVPAICDHSGAVADRVNGWPKLVPADGDGQPDEAILEASRYVDAVNFAARCNADAIMSVGFIDAVCPPTSCYAAYNVLSGKKKMLPQPLMGHAAPPHIHNAFFDQIQNHVGQRTPR